mmetsp:Transcript_107827/g.207293  ORF Transcript_107827/g.207293 Transcript_107827/m.207293 type:complete len:216 (+) Transcript_107827:510-1157(+)
MLSSASRWNRHLMQFSGFSSFITSLSMVLSISLKPTCNVSDKVFSVYGLKGVFSKDRMFGSLTVTKSLFLSGFGRFRTMTSSTFSGNSSSEMSPKMSRSSISLRSASLGCFCSEGGLAGVGIGVAVTAGGAPSSSSSDPKSSFSSSSGPRPGVSLASSSEPKSSSSSSSMSPAGAVGVLLTSGWALPELGDASFGSSSSPNKSSSSSSPNKSFSS